MPCAPGRAISTVGGVRCLPCVAGRYADRTGSSECMLCHTGSIQPHGQQSTCLPCPPGFAAERPGMTNCSRCGPREYQPNSAAAWCLPCKTHVNANRTACAEPLFCPAGTAPSSDWTCEACLVGKAATAGQTSCDQCLPEFYTTRSGAEFCFTCQADSGKGLWCANGLAAVKPDFWAWEIAASGELRTHPCPSGLCRGGLFTGNTSLCSENRDSSRDNVLCGRCVTGFAPVGSDCVPCESADHPMLMAVVLLLWVAVLGLHVLIQGPSHTEIELLSFFAAASHLVLSSSGVERLWARWLAFVNLEDMSSVGSTCLMPVGPFTLLSQGILVPLLACGLLGCTALLEHALRHCTRIALRQRSYARTLVALACISSSSVSEAALSAFVCVRVGAAEVLWVLPSVDCSAPSYKTWRAAMAFCVAAVALLPVTIALGLVWAKRTGTFGSERFQRRFGAMLSGFREGAFYFEAVALGRRLLLSSVSVALWHSAVVRVLTLGCVFALLLVLQFVLRPYSTDRANALESLSLLAALLLAMLQGASTGVGEADSRPLEAMQLCVFFGTLGTIVCAIAWTLLSEWRAKTLPSARPSESTHYVPLTDMSAAPRFRGDSHG